MKTELQDNTLRGLSSRMNSFKPLLRISSGETFIEHIAKKLNRVCEEVIIVTGHESNVLIEHLNNVLPFKYTSVYNENYNSGMFTSLKAALRNSDADWYLYHFVDQPSLDIILYEELIKNIETGVNWIQPVYNGKKGHPILFDKHVSKLIKLNSDQGNLRDLNKDNSIIKKYWECESDKIFQDIDNPEDYNNM